MSGHETDTNVTDAGLQRIGLLHRLMAGIVASYIPVVVLLYLVQLPEWIILGVAVALVVAGLLLAFIIGYSRCPACGQWFHVRGMAGNIFVRKCMHCGLRL